MQRALELDLPDARQLRLFDLLYSTRSASKTAEQMGTTQPTVSNWLRRLRLQLHDPLFVKTSKGMQPTPRADDLIDDVRSALEAIVRLAPTPKTFDYAHSERSFRICMTDSLHVTLLPPLLTRIRELAPQVRLVTSIVDAAVNEKLRNGDADLAVGVISGIEAGFYQQSLFAQDWICLARIEHPRLHKCLTLEQYRAEKHIGVSLSIGLHILQSALKAQGIVRDVVLETTGYLGISGILAGSDLIATLPRHIGERVLAIGGIRAFDCPFEIPKVPVKQYWHARYHNDPGNQWLRATCAKLFLESRPRTSAATIA